MTYPVLLALANLALIGLLPRVFFRRDGRLNGRWWLTAAPFFISGATLLAGGLGLIAPVTTPAGVVATFCSVVSIVAIGLTILTHRVPLALWHQDNDSPVELVTAGPYRLVRHPFYGAFLVGLVGCLLAFPHLITLATLMYAAVVLDVTARREERRLLGSTFGSDYERYMRQTGRLLPMVGRSS